MDSADGEGGGQQPLSFWIHIRGSSSLPKQQKRCSLELHLHQEDRLTINMLGLKQRCFGGHCIGELRVLGSFAEGNACNLPALTKHFSGPWNVCKCGFSLSGDASSQQDHWGWKCNQVWRSLIGSGLVPAHAVGRFQTVASGRGNFIALFVTRVNQYASSGLAMTRSPSGRTLEQ